MHAIRLITTGGTIASRAMSDGGPVTAAVSGGDLLHSLPQMPEGVDLTIDEFANIGSYAMTLQSAFSLAMRIDKALEDPAIDGVVVTHGTDTMAESAWMADLLVRSEKPVVFTGAQRTPDEPGADGPRNIADAIRIASAPEVRGLGAIVAFEQEFHAARDVTKSHASRVDAFVSYEHGKLGEVDGERVVVHRRPVLRRHYAATGVVEAVDLIALAIGSTGAQLRFAVENGAGAIVIEGFGRGNATPAVTEAAVEAVRAGVPVVMTTRCQRGRVRPIYGDGGGRTLADGGVIFAGDLSGPKARVLMAVLLGMGYDGDRLRTEVEALGG